jgi:hypothetical protein
MFLHETSGKALPRILSELTRVLAPGGLMLHLEQPQYGPDMPLYEQFIRDWDAFNNNEPFWTAMHGLDLKEEIVRAGFGREDLFTTGVTAVVDETIFPSPRARARRTMAARPRGTLMGRGRRRRERRARLDAARRQAGEGQAAALFRRSRDRPAAVDRDGAGRRGVGDARAAGYGRAASERQGHDRARDIERYEPDAAAALERVLRPANISCGSCAASAGPRGDAGRRPARGRGQQALAKRSYFRIWFISTSVPSGSKKLHPFTRITGPPFRRDIPEAAARWSRSPGHLRRGRAAAFDIVGVHHDHMPAERHRLG